MTTEKPRAEYTEEYQKKVSEMADSFAKNCGLTNGTELFEAVVTGFDSGYKAGERNEAYRHIQTAGKLQSAYQSLLKQAENLERALEYYAEGEQCCAVTEKCKHPACEFPSCAAKQFPTWDRGDKSKSALEQFRAFKKKAGADE